MIHPLRKAISSRHAILRPQTTLVGLDQIGCPQETFVRPRVQPRNTWLQGDDRQFPALEIGQVEIRDFKLTPPGRL